MRILLYTQWCAPEPAFKAVPFARELRRRGHDARILTGFPNYPGGRLYPGYRVRLRQREELDGVPVLRVPLFPSHDASSARRMLNYLSFAAASAPALWFGWRPDVIHIYNLVTLGAVAALHRFLRRVPYVLDVQDLWPDSIFQAGMGARWMRRPVDWACAFAYRNATRLAVQSPGFHRVLRDRGVPEDRLSVVYNWCDESGLPEKAPDPSARTAGGFDDGFHVLYSGNLGRLQSLETAIDAAAIVARTHPHVRFVFMGRGVELEALQRRAAAVAPANTRFLPARPLREALVAQQCADALLISLKDDPLFRVTIPSKTQASLALGRPILAALRGDAADLVLQARAGVSCEPGNPAALAAAAIQLAELPAAERDAMGRRGAAFYRDHLSFARGVDRFEQLFAEATGTTRTKPA